MFGKKIICISIILLIFSICLGVVSANDNATADIIENDNEQMIIKDNEVSEIQKKIDEAEDGSTIQLDKDYTTDRLVINKSITIKGHGEGSLINNTPPSSLEINSGNVTLDNLKFLNFNSIKTNNTKLTIINCTFDGFKYSGSYVNANELNIINSKFVNSAGFSFDGKVTNFNNCSFSKFLIEFKGDSINIANCILNESNISNIAGVYIIGNSVSIINSTIRKSVFTMESERGYILNSTFNDGFSVIQSNNVNGCVFKNIKLNLKLLNSNSNLLNSRFINCTDWQWEFIRSNKNINIENCEFINNFLADSGVIYLEFGKSAVVLNNTFLNNHCPSIISAVSTIPDYNAKTSKETKIDSKFNLNNNLFIGNMDKDNAYSRIYITPTIVTYNFVDYFANELDMKNNFFGFNMYDDIELELLKPLYITNYWHGDDYWYSMAHWANLKLINKGQDEHGNYTYNFDFVDVNGESVEIPNTTFSIVDKTTKEILISNISSKSSFKLDRNVDFENAYIINSADGKVNKDTANITITVTGTDFADIDIRFSLKNGTQPLSRESVYGSVAAQSDEKNPLQYMKFETSEDGNSIFYNEDCGWGGFSAAGNVKYYNITLIFSNYQFGLTKMQYNYLIIKKVDIQAKMDAITSTYNIDKKASATINCKFKYLHPVLDVDFYNGKKLVKSISFNVKNGKNTFKIPKLDAGTYKVVLWGDDEYYKINKVTTTLTVKKAQTTVKAPKITAKAKKSKYFKVTVKDKTTKKAINKGTVIKLKIGKKTYKVKTNKKGVAQFNTKKLKRGNYKVVISSGSGNYKISAKSKITIK